MSEALRKTGTDLESLPDDEFSDTLAGYGIDKDLINAALARAPGTRMHLVQEVMLEQDPDIQEYVGPPLPSV